jgi:hypothetical protein
VSSDLYHRYRKLWLQPVKGGRFGAGHTVHCCVDMRAALTFDCEQHADPFECPDYLVAYNEVTDEYGLPIHDGAASVLIIAHCPFCGCRLPDSKADRWFDELEALGISGVYDDKIPEKYQSDAWWRMAPTQKDR